MLRSLLLVWLSAGAGALTVSGRFGRLVAWLLLRERLVLTR
jgi:hypothetical protein